MVKNIKSVQPFSELTEAAVERFQFRVRRRSTWGFRTASYPTEMIPCFVGWGSIFKALLYWVPRVKHQHPWENSLESIFSQFYFHVTEFVVTWLEGERAADYTIFWSREACPGADEHQAHKKETHFWKPVVSLELVCNSTQMLEGNTSKKGMMNSHFYLMVKWVVGTEIERLLCQIAETHSVIFYRLLRGVILITK